MTSLNIRLASLALGLSLLTGTANAATVIATLPAEGWSATALVGGQVAVQDQGAVLQTSGNAGARAELRVSSGGSSTPFTSLAAMIAGGITLSYTVKADSPLLPELMLGIVGVSDFGTLRYKFDAADATVNGDWVTYTIDAADALFWSKTDQRRLDIVAGIDKAQTLGDWAAKIDDPYNQNLPSGAASNNRFANAVVSTIVLGFDREPGQSAVVGAFSMTGTQRDIHVTFGGFTAPAAVPLPAGLPLLLAGLGALGLVVRRNKTAAV